MSTTTDQFTDYQLPSDAYVAFDALSLKDFIINRLNDNSSFTDQNYEGSNLAAFIDIIAYSYHVLLFYLNNTAAEGMFNQATLYENMNKIISLINYKPTGKQTALLSINASADSNLIAGDYTIPKYSFFIVDGIQYTFNKDYSFTKLTNSVEDLTELTDTVILYQGTIGEYPNYTAEGEDFETLIVVVDNVVDETDQRFIAGDTISVYVKEAASDTYYEYTEVENLYLSEPSERVYELRLNENGHYEIKFGNGKSGKKLSEDDIVKVFYILSDNLKGVINKAQLNGNRLNRFASETFSEIYNDITPNIEYLTLIDKTNSSYLSFANTSNSTVPSEEETVDDLKVNVPRIFSSQLRLVTEADYEVFLQKTFPNLINSIKVVNNETYINGYIQYFYDICVDPGKTNRAIINSVNFADSCDFNNINIFVVPKFTITEDESYPPFLSTSFKQLIVDTATPKKMISNEVVPRDPIYKTFDIGFSNNITGVLNKDEIITDTKLYIVRENKSKINKFTIRSQVIGLIRDFFGADNNELSSPLLFSSLTSEILSLNGVKSVYTKNTEQNVIFSGLSFIAWNPLYPDDDIEIVNQDTTLPYFMFPYLWRPNSLINNIEVIDE